MATDRGEYRQAAGVHLDKGRSGFDNDNTHYPYFCRRLDDWALIRLWLASLHDRKRGTCQVS
jgi:hypothetical protein